MKQSGYMKRRNAYTDAKCEAVRQVHQQIIFDCLSAQLHDEDAMCGEPWEPARIRDFANALADKVCSYMPAIEGGVEADVKQEHLDRELRPVWEEFFEPFEQRYPQIKKITY